MSTGRSAATVLATALLDELFYVIAVPVIVLIAGIDAFFPKELPDFGDRPEFKPCSLAVMRWYSVSAL